MNRAKSTTYTITKVEVNTAATAALLKRGHSVELMFHDSSTAVANQSIRVQGVSWEINTFRKGRSMSGKLASGQFAFEVTLRHKRLYGTIRGSDPGGETDPGAWEADIEGGNGDTSDGNTDS